jgi:HAD superfamily hydrolase (TIGR01509 family)
VLCRWREGAPRADGELMPVAAAAPPLPECVRAVVFDVDGTLYRQRPVRLSMLARLVRAYALRPTDGRRVARALGAYRRAQERARLTPAAALCGPHEQAALAARECGLPAATVATIVERWMEQEPLDLVGRAAMVGMADFLRTARAAGTRLATLSDYPAAAKLGALGVGDLFDLSVSAQDEPVRAFKPDPRGLRFVLERLGVRPEEAVYVGDRPEVDALAAARAGVAAVIVGRAATGSPAGGARWTAVRDYAALGALLRGRLAPPVGDASAAPRGG